MSTTATRSKDATTDARVGKVDMKLEVVTIPVSDADRATKFYLSLGWRQDVTPPGSGVVQFTPPGSSCSIQFGTNRTSAAPGSAQNQFLIVSDIQAARDDLTRRGVKVSEIFHLATGGQASGPDPERRSYHSLAAFSDPDGNSWLMQEITTRLPGRVDATETAFGSASDLASAFRRAEAAHGEHEKRTGQRDADWPSWYAAYMVAEQHGTELPT
jgi:catechol 2,3-dioxygenase-like lactoylglutathione lyase family enzyme